MKLRTLLLLSTLTLGTSAVAIADNVTPSGADRPDRPSAAVMQHLADGRVAYIEAALKLNSDQQKAWQPVAELLRQRPPRPAFGDHQPGDHAASLSDMLTRRAQTMSSRADYEQKLATALKSLEATLSPEQKETLKIAFFSSMPHPMMHGRPGFGDGMEHRPHGDAPTQPDAAPSGDQSQPGYGGQ
jgi:hypothetical protein